MRAIAQVTLLIGFSLISLKAQQTLNVPSTPYPTIQSAINAAANGDMIQVAAGTYAENLQVGQGITIMGAGQGLTILDGNQLGRCLEINLNSGDSLTIRDLDIVNGRNYSVPYIPSQQGGGIHFLINTPVGPTTLNMENVTVSGCRAPIGGGLYAGPSTLVNLTNCEFHTNGFVVGGPINFNPNGGAVFTAGTLTAQGCNFHDNRIVSAAVGGSGGAIVASGMAQCFFEDCNFDDNSCSSGAAFAGINANNMILQMKSCKIRGNTGTLNSSAIRVSIPVGGHIKIENCLFARNVSQVFEGCCVLVADLVEVRGCTIVSNQPAANYAYGVITTANSMTVDISNSIFADNGPDAPAADTNSNGVFTAKNCLFDTTPVSSSLLDPSNIKGISPGFVNPVQDDFHLLPSSVALNAGSSLASDLPFDLDGLPRNQLGAPDMGCYELQSGQEDPGTSWAGTVSDLMGGLEDLLLVNGTAGGVGRRVNTAIGSTTTIAVNAAAGSLGGNFIIWGRIGLPSAVETFPIPFALGSMAFVPHILAIGDPALFTFASSSLPGGIFATPPAPWSITGSSLTVPLTITLQGLIETGGGNVRLTNAIAIHNF